MKIYTKTGDDGTTGLFAGGRVGKDHPRIVAYGSVDELNAVLGIAIAEIDGAIATVKMAEGRPETLALCRQSLLQVQHDLFSLGAELATPNPEKHGTKLIAASHITSLENWIDRLEEDLPPLTNFILPGGTLASAQLHLARTVCRRAERDVVGFAHEPQADACDEVITYLNRLSDLLFVMARAVNRALNTSDILWRK